MQTPPLPTNPETPLTPPSSCCSPKSKLLCLSVGLVVLAIVATASFLLGKYSSQNKTPAPTTKVTPKPTLLPTPTPDLTADWKTYTNQALGFELKYPPSVKIDKEFNDQNNRATLFSGEGLSFEVMLRDGSGINLDNYYYMDSEVKRKTTLAGLPANVYELPNGYCDGPSCSKPSITIVAKKGSNLYHLMFSGDIQLSETENQILSTFKFLDQKEPTNEPSVSSLKIWRGIGVTFKYPDSWQLKQPVSTVLKPESGGFYQQGFSGSSGSNINLILFTKIRTKDADGNYKSLGEEMNLPEKHHITIGGKDGMRADYADLYSSEVYNLVAETLYDDVTIVGLQLIVQPSSASSIYQAKSIFDDILSTFKFLD